MMMSVVGQRLGLIKVGDRLHGSQWVKHKKYKAEFLACDFLNVAI